MATFYATVAYDLPAGTSSPTLNIPFQYLRPEDIFVFSGNTRINPGTTGMAGRWEFVTPTQVKINTSFNTASKVWIRRFTRKDERLAEYFNGATLTEYDLNIVTTQLLYLIQEMTDYVDGSNSGNPPPGGTGGNDGDGNDPPTIIDEIIDELLDSQLFRDLIELIELNDINAESILSNTLQNHEKWSRDTIFDKVINDLDVGLASIDTRFTNEIDELITANEARITQIAALQARLGEAEADIIEVNTARVTADEAMTTRINVAESRIGGAEARIGTVETTYATKEFASTEAVTQFNSKFPAAFTNGVNTSSVIQGISTKATKTEASASGIVSYIAGIGAQINPTTGAITWPSPATGGMAVGLATVQQTVSAHTTQLQAEASFRTALASRFQSGQPNGALSPDPLVAAIESTWRTWVDSYSTTAAIATTLQVNRQPILFGSSIPNPWRTPLFNNPTTGIPSGSLWYFQSGPTLIPFYWNGSQSTQPAGNVGQDWWGPFVDAGNNTRPGYWMRKRDTQLETVLGARIDNYAETGIFANKVNSLVEQKLVAVYDTADFTGVTAISERLQSLIDNEIDPATGKPRGLMYSSWNVRINQYAGPGTTPVIAGVGLGMQRDINNPSAPSRSQFIVMADQFGLVKPPASGDWQNGAIDLSTFEVPFIVDTGRNKVIVNSQLLARSMNVLDGYAGRLTFTQLNPLTYEPVDANGMRLVLPSSTNNWNAANNASPFTGVSPQRFLVWAGTGAMSHNNAKFYVDTDGNAVFRGQVLADNIDGNVSKAALIYWTGNLAASGSHGNNNYGPFHLITSATVPTSAGINGLTALSTVTGEFYEDGGTSSGRFRMTMQPAGGSETEVANVPFLATSRGQPISLCGMLPNPTNAAITVRIYFSNYDGQTTTVKSVRGFAMGIR